MTTSKLPSDSAANLRPLVHDVIPTVIETGPRSERAFDIFSLLLKERIVFLGTPIDDQIANLIVAQLLYLQREDPERDISLYIHSPGGVISSGLAIYDTIQLIGPPSRPSSSGRLPRWPPSFYVLEPRERGSLFRTPLCICTRPSAAPVVKLLILRSRPKRSSVTMRSSGISLPGIPNSRPKP